MASNRLIYIPLGGAGEIGMNMYVYGYGPRGRERLIVVDIGVCFSDVEQTPGIDLIMPDFSWLDERRDRIEAVFLTHAHEDHIGAVPFFLEKFPVDVYARPFTYEIVTRKLEDRGLDNSRLVLAKQMPEKLPAGPFRVGYLPISHSVPQSSSLVIDCPAGRLLHTGDIKIDETPVVGEPFDADLWSKFVPAGVMAAFSDSTNIHVKQSGRSEASVGTALPELFAGAQGAVFATSFASNIARVQQIAKAGQHCGRSVVLLGRAMNEMIDAALSCGMINGFPPTVSVEHARDIPDRHLLYIATGSQGEPRSATSHLANGKYRGIQVGEGDLFLFSSKTIPGNERSVSRVVNKLSQKGVQIVDESAGDYHVSGHANLPDLGRLYDLIQPKLVVPVHGEHRHLASHAEFARKRGTESIVVENGEVLDVLARRVIPQESGVAGRIYLDGKVLFDSQEVVLRARKRMAREGSVSLSVVVINGRVNRGNVQTVLHGLPVSEIANPEKAISREVEKDLYSFNWIGQRSKSKLEKSIETSARRAVQKMFGKRPIIGVSIHWC